MELTVVAGVGEDELGSDAVVAPRGKRARDKEEGIVATSDEVEARLTGPRAVVEKPPELTTPASSYG